MKTEDLIAGLSRDPRPAMASPPALLGRALLVGAPLALVAMLAGLGLRADLASAMFDGWFLLKLTLVALVAVVGFRLTSLAAQPGRHVPRALPLVLFAALAAAIALETGVVGLEDWRERMLGDNALVCLVAIPILSLAPLAGALWALRESAPANASLAGASAGLFASGVGALVYGLHCWDDSPLFLAVWYVGAIGLVTLAGALIGRRLLRW